MHNKYNEKKIIFLKFLCQLWTGNSQLRNVTLCCSIYNFISNVKMFNKDVQQSVPTRKGTKIGSNIFFNTSSYAKTCDPKQKIVCSYAGWASTRHKHIWKKINHCYIKVISFFLPTSFIYENQGPMTFISGSIVLKIKDLHPKLVSIASSISTTHLP